MLFLHRRDPFDEFAQFSKVGGEVEQPAANPTYEEYPYEEEDEEQLDFAPQNGYSEEVYEQHHELEMEPAEPEKTKEKKPKKEK